MFFFLASAMEGAYHRVKGRNLSYHIGKSVIFLLKYGSVAFCFYKVKKETVDRVCHLDYATYRAKCGMSGL